MRYTEQQHLEMAERLDKRSKTESDSKKAARQKTMASVFRRLAKKAAEKSLQTRTPAFDEHAPSATSSLPDPKWIGLIDSPGPFESLEDWEAYLDELQTMRDHDLVRSLIDEAEKIIAEKRRRANP
jgi:hypothetical protein